MRSWGGPGQGYEWPESMHGIHIDYKGNVWLGGNGAKDSQILKFTQDGKFLLQSGHQGKNAGSNDPENFGRVAQIYIDPKNAVGHAFEVRGLPTSILVDREGKVLGRVEGAADWDSPKIMGILEPFLSADSVVKASSR